MNSPFAKRESPKTLRGFSPALVTGGLGVFLYGICVAGVTPFVAAAIGLVPIIVGLFAQWPALALGAVTVAVAAEVSQNLTYQFGLPSIGDIIVPGAAFVLCVRFVLLGEKPFLSPKALIGLGGLLVWSALTILHARYWEVAQTTAFNLAKDMILVVLMLAFIDSARMLRFFLSTLIALFSVICVLGLYSYIMGLEHTFYGFVGFAFVERRFTGPYSDANYFGSFLVFLIPICISRILADQQTRHKLFGLFGAAALSTGLLLTASRGDLLALLASLPIFLFFLKKRARFWMVGAGVGVAALIALLLSDALIDRYEFLIEPSVASPNSDSSVEGRLASWEVAGQLFYDHPLAGVGAGNFNAYFQDTALRLGLIFRGEGRSAHSLYLEVLAEQGIFGLGLLLVVLTAAVATPLRLGMSLARAEANAQSMEVRGFAIGLVAMLFARIFLHDDYPLLLWLAVAIGLAARQIYRDSVLASTDL